MSNSSSNESLNTPLCKHAISYYKQLKQRLEEYHLYLLLNRQKAKRLGSQIIIDLEAYSRICADVGVWNADLESEIRSIRRRIKKTLKTIK
jgi:uncharacterized protein YuzE